MVGMWRQHDHTYERSNKKYQRLSTTTNSLPPAPHVIHTSPKYLLPHSKSATFTFFATSALSCHVLSTYSPWSKIFVDSVKHCSSRCY
ncbi:hypothetical protein ACSQ67_000581 [Phaseolus vulgaris]